jgi:hypothetical protein
MMPPQRAATGATVDALDLHTRQAHLLLYLHDERGRPTEPVAISPKAAREIAAALLLAADRVTAARVRPCRINEAGELVAPDEEGPR